MQVKAGVFDRLMILFNVACTRNGFDQVRTKAFVEVLESKKEFMVSSEVESDKNEAHSLMESLSND